MQSVFSLLLIGGVICFTFVVIEVITTSYTFEKIVSILENIGIKKDLSTAILSGLFEITGGCLMLSYCKLTFNIATIICTFIISFGGISTFLQSIAFTKGIVKEKTFLLQKITHAICASFVSAILTAIF